MRKVAIGPRVEAFIKKQYSWKEATTTAYEQAIMSFNLLGGCIFENVYMDEEFINSVLADALTIYEDSSWNLNLTIYKRIAKYLHDPEDDDCPRLWHKIKEIPIDQEEKLKDKWFSEEEIIQILTVCYVLRDQAIFGFGLSGLRRGEILSPRLRDVETYGSIGYRIMVTGKTGTRPVYVTRFAPLIRNWLNVHPLRNNVNAPLFVNLHTGNYEELTPDGLYKAVKKWILKSGINRKGSPHWLRHTKVTWTAKNTQIKISNETANKMFGWKKGSTQYSHYTHIAGQDVEDAALTLEGVEGAVKKAEKPSLLEAQKCFGCGEMNPVGALYCYKCGCVLDEAEARAKIRKERILEYLAKEYAEKLGDE